MVIESVSSFLEAIKTIGLREGYHNYYRGHSNIAFELTPGIYRNNQIAHEDRLFREIISRVPHEFAGHKTALENLVKMQHYGLPTRLLDITSNPLVALFFACNNDKDKDGRIVFMQIPNNYIKFYDSDTVSILANIPKQPLHFDFQPFESSISAFNSLQKIEFLLHNIKEEKPHFKNIINPKHLQEVYAVKVKLDNSRILKQSGAFLIFGIQATKSEHAKVPHEWIMNGQTSVDLVVPKGNKNSIIKDLDILGINESQLFPEIDYQAKYLTKAIIKSI